MDLNSELRPRVGMIIQQAFSYWRQTIFYQFFFSLLFFSVFFLVIYYFGMKLGLLDMYSGAIEKLKISTAEYMREVQRIGQTDESRRMYWAYTLTLVFLFPLNLGLMAIYRKIDLKETYGLADLLAGYNGINFLIYTGFYLFWLMVFNLTLPTLLIPFFWVVATLFCAPLMFFQNKRIGEGINLSIKVFRKYPAEILACVLFALVIRYAGIFSIVGALFTFPIWNAVIYVLYKNLFSENESVTEAK